MERSRRTGWALIGIIVALGLALTACGTRPSPASGTAPPRTAALNTAASQTGPPHGSRVASLALAGRMVRHLRLPSGSRVIRPHPVPQLLRQPAEEQGFPLRVDGTRFYAAPGSVPATYAYLRGHVPAGYRLKVSGSEGNVDGTLVWLVGYDPKSLPPGISDADLIIGVVPGRHGGSVLRADGQVGWFPPRSAAEYLRPGAYRAVTITGTTMSSGRPTSEAIRSRAALARLERLLNSRHAANGGPLSCPLGGVPSYRLVFRPRAGHPRFEVMTSGCPSDEIVVAGRSQPELWDPGNRVGALAQRLLHHRAG